MSSPRSGGNRIVARTFTQMEAVTVMNLRSIPQRLWTSLATVIAVALVTGVLLSFLMMPLLSPWFGYHVPRMF